MASFYFHAITSLADARKKLFLGGVNHFFQSKFSTYSFAYTPGYFVIKWHLGKTITRHPLIFVHLYFLHLISLVCRYWIKFTVCIKTSQKEKCNADTTEFLKCKHCYQLVNSVTKIICTHRDIFSLATVTVIEMPFHFLKNKRSFISALSYHSYKYLCSFEFPSIMRAYYAFTGSFIRRLKNLNTTQTGINNLLWQYYALEQKYLSARRFVTTLSNRHLPLKTVDRHYLTL